ncbi:MAG: CinA family nicotinamide mononucleotide deamidase-related protein [Candidatus Marivariicella sp.]|tara:strand:+ start:2452 stop:3717 length:1266 start_codon:yes stop_codon:yes gene_type:complete
MIAQIINIGDEILIGQIINTNGAFLSKSLNSIGITVSEIISISDKKEDIINCIERSRKKSDIIIITGGLGPTNDDVTKHALTNYFNDKLVWNNEIKNHIEDLFKKFISTPIVDMNREQALLPSKAKIYKNEYGTASAMWFSQKDIQVISLPGVPYEMKSLMNNSILPELKLKFKRPFIYNKTLLTYGLGESAIANRIKDWENKLPKNLKFAYLPSLGRVRLRLSSSGKNKTLVKNEVDRYLVALKKLIKDIYVGEEDDGPIESQVTKILRNNYKSISIAESCTGGLISSRITSIPGVSEFYKGGVVAYSNEIKSSVLNIPNELIETNGVVSSKIAELMALNIKKIYKTDYSVATTGNAGPTTGDLISKVGDVYIAIATPEGVFVKFFKMGNHRERIIKKTTNKVFEILLKVLKANKDYNFE